MPWMGPSNCQGYLAASIDLVLTTPAYPTTQYPGWANQIARATWRRPLTCHPRRRHPPPPNGVDGPVKLPWLPGGVPWPSPPDAGIPYPCPGWARHIARATWRRPLTWSSPRRYPLLPNGLDGPIKLPGLPGGVPKSPARRQLTGSP
jgi:hypothetical protein